jgi:hypothetical protein
MDSESPGAQDNNPKLPAIWRLPHRDGEMEDHGYIMGPGGVAIVTGESRTEIPRPSTFELHA